LALKVDLYTPHDNQLKVHQSINNEPYKYYILNIGRQWGKSLLATNQLLYWCFNQDNTATAWVSPIYKQAKRVFDDIDRAFGNNQQIFKKKDATNLTMQFINNSTIQFFSAERYDNIRGFTFDYLVCDEFAFMDEEAWTEVLRATVLVRGKKVLLISTPKGKNHFYRMFNLDGINDQYKSFRMTSYDNPIINPTEIDDARYTLPEHVFKQEYLAEFIDGGAGLFNGIITNEESAKTDRYYAGVDIGRVDDYTVISIFNDRGQQVFIERFRHDSWANISRKVAEIINRYDAFTLVEVNSIGDAVFEQIKNHCNNPPYVNPFVTTSKSKNDIIERLSVAVQNKEVTFRNTDWLLKEFDIFTFEFNPKSKSIRYAAPSGFHDDGVMATAIAFEALKSKKTAGEYYII
jgi:hypothetical protein